MPAILPALAGFGAASWFVGSSFAIGMGTFALAASTIAIGAVVGAAVGGLSAAITGGDIGEGLLYGAVGGAVGGVLGGYFGPELFGSTGVESGGSALGGSANTNIADFMLTGEGPFGAGGSLTSAGQAAVNYGAEAGAGFFSGDMTKYALISGGAQMFGGLTAKEPYAASEEGTAARIAAEKEINSNNNQTQKEITEAQIAQRKYEADLANKQFYDNLARQQTEFQNTLAQRRYETDLPFAQAEAARDRMRETASGLTLARKQAEAAATSGQQNNDEINQFIYG